MAEGNGNVLFDGDNLDVLRRHVKDESVDLVYRGELRVLLVPGARLPPGATPHRDRAACRQTDRNARHRTARDTSRLATRPGGADPPRPAVSERRLAAAGARTRRLSVRPP